MFNVMISLTMWNSVMMRAESCTVTIGSNLDDAAYVGLFSDSTFARYRSQCSPEEIGKTYGAEYTFLSLFMIATNEDGQIVELKKDVY